MASRFEYGTISSLEDSQALGMILQQCFNSSAEASEAYRARLGLENFRAVRQSGRIVGGLAILPMGQWFGAQCVPMAGIASVGVAPEHRGSGAALALMQHTLQDLSAQGIALSALYPATQYFYRQVGYEQGGVRCDWEIRTDSIQLKERTLPITLINDAQHSHEVFANLYQQQAKANNGCLERNQAIWKGIFESPNYAYLIGEEAHPEGYLIFSQHAENNHILIQIRDWVLLTPAAIKRFWTFLADHRSMVEKVRWHHSSFDSLTFLLDERTTKINYIGHWLLRIIDVQKALEQRGYPKGIETEVHLEVQDDLLTQNNGKFILKVSEGQGEVCPGGRGELRLSIRGLAPLYTGLFTPEQLQRTGQLEATDKALSAATHLFLGNLPWMPDYF
jgi:predicted acetyltransferase